jgi:hypothetical protein
MNEAALSRQVEAELELFTYPVQDWVRPLRGPNGAAVHNVVIVGGGQAGLAIAFGLARERISGVVVLDDNPSGPEGPWISYARMITLRTLKFLTGIHEHILNWADRHVSPADRTNAEMGRHPYLGPGFELLENTSGTMSGLSRIRMFNGGAVVSASPVAPGLNGMPFGLPRLIKHMSCDLLRDQAGAKLEEFEIYGEPDA